MNIIKDMQKVSIFLDQNPSRPALEESSLPFVASIKVVGVPHIEFAHE